MEKNSTVIKQKAEKGLFLGGLTQLFTFSDNCITLELLELECKNSIQRLKKRGVKLCNCICAW